MQMCKSVWAKKLLVQDREQMLKNFKMLKTQSILQIGTH